MKNLLFIGDVVGKAGTDFFISEIHELKREYNIDVVIVNGENGASGNGVTRQSVNALLQNGADVVTTGNHAFHRREQSVLFDELDGVVRPANYPEESLGIFSGSNAPVYEPVKGEREWENKNSRNPIEKAPGKGVYLLDCGQWQLCVINLQGVVFMDALDNPFTTIDRLLQSISTPNILVDFHAEATAEKKALGYHLDGRVTAVLGTHTHVQTADETILPGGTAYLTDVGMTGPEDSVLGVRKELAIEKFRTHYPVRFLEAETACFLCAVVISFNEKNGKAVEIQRVIRRNGKKKR